MGKTMIFHLPGYRVVRPVQKKKKMMRLKILGSYVRIEQKWALVLALGSVAGFFGLAGFLYYLWYIHIPCLQAGVNVAACP